MQRHGRGHGGSSVDFLDCTFDCWLRDVLLLVDHVTQVPAPALSSAPAPALAEGGGAPAAAGDGRVLLVGSSLGAWLGLHAALLRPRAVRGLVLVAPAVDVTLFWEQLGARHQGTDDAGRELLRLPSNYVEASGPPAAWQMHGRATVHVAGGAARSGGILVRREVVDEANARHLLLGTGRLAGLTCPVAILASAADEVVPLSFVLALAAELERSCCSFGLTVVEQDSDHRVSTPRDLEELSAAVGRVLAASERGACPERVC
eukprot:scaffold2.g7045.t1